jgi:hypothetical protein
MFNVPVLSKRQLSFSSSLNQEKVQEMSTVGWCSTGAQDIISVWSLLARKLFYISPHW